MNVVVIGGAGFICSHLVDRLLPAVDHRARLRGLLPFAWLVLRDIVVANLGYELTRRFDAAAVKRALTADKKRIKGRQRWILPMAIGHVIDVDDITEAELDGAITHIHAGGTR